MVVMPTVQERTNGRRAPVSAGWNASDSVSVPRVKGPKCKLISVGHLISVDYLYNNPTQIPIVTRAAFDGRTLGRAVGGVLDSARVMDTSYAQLVDSDFDTSTVQLLSLDPKLSRWSCYQFRIDCRVATNFRFDVPADLDKIAANFRAYARSIELIHQQTGKDVYLFWDTETYASGDTTKDIFKFLRWNGSAFVANLNNPANLTFDQMRDKVRAFFKRLTETLLEECPSLKIVFSLGYQFAHQQYVQDSTYPLQPEKLKFGLLTDAMDGATDAIKNVRGARHWDMLENAYDADTVSDFTWLLTNGSIGVPAINRARSPEWRSYSRFGFSLAPQIFAYAAVSAASASTNTLQLPNFNNPGGGRTELWISKAGDYDGPGMIRQMTSMVEDVSVTISGPPIAAEVGQYVGFLSPKKFYEVLNAAEQLAIDYDVEAIQVYEGGPSTNSLAQPVTPHFSWHRTVSGQKILPGEWFRALEAFQLRQSYNPQFEY